MSQPVRNKGPWIHRFLTYLFSTLFGILIFWLLGFVVDDIGSWPGPNYRELEEAELSPALIEQQKTLARQIAETDRNITDQKARQELLRDSTTNSQRTMDQLLDFQRMSLGKNVTPSPEEQNALAESQQRFLANQKQYQTLNEELVRLNEELRRLKQEQRDLEERLGEERKPIREQFDDLRRAHDLKMAALKLSVLVPLLLVGVAVFCKLRNGPYAPPVNAFGIAVLVKVGTVMHEYFPTKYFKYVLILAALVVVARILLVLVRTVAFPKKEWLIKQYREAYEGFLCPICSYPIRRGPLRYMFWTRRSIKKVTPPAESTAVDEPYVCPTCSTRLYEKCEECGAIRPSLLPSCESCGAVKNLPPASP